MATVLRLVVWGISAVLAFLFAPLWVFLPIVAVFVFMTLFTLFPAPDDYFCPACGSLAVKQEKTVNRYFCATCITTFTTPK